jgi:hypothetical protein
MAPDTADPVHAFITKWQGAGGSERANYQLFISDLCELLDVERPQPAREDTRDNAYVFERRVTFSHGDGSTSAGYIDCYRRGHFVLEAKKLKATVGGATKGFDDALLRARAQAEGYARALPAAEGRPPFVVVVDVGHVIELYAEFTRSGATYTPFPDARSHRIRLADLQDDSLRERLRLLWLDPLALDPSRASARVTGEVAAQLAILARSVEAAGHAPQTTAAFLTRCLFSMFAEDVGLLPKGPDGSGGFVALLQRHREDPRTLQRMLRVLWTDMDRGGFSAALAQDVLRFNGKLFKGWNADDYVLPLNRDQIDGLLAAARANWREVEPAIFGTLLERALDPAERHALGAHYTPRAYVERLVLPTVVQPLRADWANAQAAALVHVTEAEVLQGKKRDDKLAEARAEIRRFHHQLCTTRVLDPACGSGNFLYVTLEHLKRLEGEVLDQLDALGDTQGKLGLEGETVTLKQLLGIELNERAAALAELVLWIGWLQWHIRTVGHAHVAEPVIHDYRNVECRDAVLAWDGQEPMRDAAGAPVTRWDGVSFKRHPATGEPVPDERAVVPQWRYLNPRPAEWPQAEFIVGNPPFIGKLKVRESLGDGYVEALRDAHPDVPESADFVMYWMNQAALRLRRGELRRSGLITTNSVTMVYNRRVLDHHLESSPALHVAWAVPDHPWVDVSTSAAVRIAMTVLAPGRGSGFLMKVTREVPTAGGEHEVAFSTSEGDIQSTLRLGPAVHRALALQANRYLSHMGVILVGTGFIVEPDDPLLKSHCDRVRPYLNGRDLTQRSRGVSVIDMVGLNELEVRERYPAIWQRLHDTVKPERATSKDPYLRDNWWLFRRTNERLRSGLAGLRRYIGTTETAKHRVFSFIDGSVLPDQKIRVITVDDALVLGVLTSSAHVDWALASGGTLEDRPVYNNTVCFEPFPFPSDDTGLSPVLTDRIRALAEQLDAHRKARQAAHAELTLTGMYNVLAKLRAGEPLSAKERITHEQGLVAVVRSLHDDLDAAVLAAYGWSDLAAPLADHTPAGAEARAAAVEMLLERLVALNARRAAEEAEGTVRWLRPEFQTRPREAAAPAQAAIDLPAVPEAGAATGEADDGGDGADAPAATSAPTAPAAARRPWPAGLPDQIKAVADVLSSATRPLTQQDIETHFTARGRWRARLPVILETLVALGRARREEVGVRWRASA